LFADYLLEAGDHPTPAGWMRKMEEHTFLPKDASNILQEGAGGGKVET
jgi:hypothetical protein